MEEPEKQPKKYSFKTIGIVLTAIVFVILVVLVTVNSCSIEKENSNTTEVQQSQVEVEVQDSTETSTSKEGAVKTEEEPSTDGTKEDEEVEFVLEGKGRDTEEVPIQSSLQEVTGEVSGKVFEVNCAVSSKKVYEYEGNYVFSVNLLIPVESSGYVSTDYFCNKNTYDAVNFGDLLLVEYLVSDTGKIGIISVSN
jgi:hypothetical protein